VTHDLTEKMAAKEIVYPHRVKIAEVCRGGWAAELLSSHMDLATVVPCRISLIEMEGEPGKVYAASFSPAPLLLMVGIGVDHPISVEAQMSVLAIVESIK
jgi:uncharacterized protein (DUF302 family)